jgi:hypothetical protein
LTVITRIPERDGPVVRVLGCGGVIA